MTKSFLTFLILSLPIVSSISTCNSIHKTSQQTSIEIVESYGYISVPFHYQDNRYYCGPAALEMVFDFYGEDIPQTEIADVARTHPNVTYKDELRRAAHFSNASTSLGMEMPSNITGYSSRKVGYAAFGTEGLTTDDLEALVAGGQPIIVLMNWTQSEPDGHYRVVIGYNETHIIMHDPWNKTWGGTYGGANTAMTYSTFLLLWRYSNNWGLWIHPWSVELQAPTIVDKGENFTVTANITFPCPTPFNMYGRTAFHCNASITLPEGLTLASGEAIRNLGEINSGNAVQTSWLIHAIEAGSPSISVLATGMITDTVSEHENGSYSNYSYQDLIGGPLTISISVIPEFPSFFIFSLFMVATLLTVIFYRRRQRKRESSSLTCAF